MILASNRTIALGKLAVLALVLLTSILFAGTYIIEKVQGNHRNLSFDIAGNGSHFSFGSEPVVDSGMLADGGEFITRGYLYPYGFLETHAGVNDDGSPAYPEQVLGRWVSRGWDLGEGGQTVSGPWIVTHQYFDLGEVYGQHSITTEGYELVDINRPVNRAVTGGTGRFRMVRGQSTQEFLGFNPSFGVKLRVKFQVRRYGGSGLI